MNKNKQNIIIYNTIDGKASVSLYAKDGMVWMNQYQLAELFDTSVPNISMHISNILKEQELVLNSVVKDYLTTASDVDNILEFNDKEVLNHKGKISNAEMEQLVRKVYEKFDKKRKAYDAQLADEQDLEELKKLELKVKNSHRDGN